MASWNKCAPWIEYYRKIVLHGTSGDLKRGWFSDMPGLWNQRGYGFDGSW